MSDMKLEKAYVEHAVDYTAVGTKLRWIDEE
jgi:hypothetical protein